MTSAARLLLDLVVPRYAAAGVVHVHDADGAARVAAEAGDVDTPGARAASSLSLPLHDGESGIGTLTLRGAIESSFIEQVARMGAAAIARERAVDDERRANERMRRIQRLTEALAPALTTARVAEVVLEHGTAALEARSGLLMLLDRTGQTLEIVGARGIKQDMFTRGHRPSPLDGGSISDAVRLGRAIFDEGADGTGRSARVALPLFARGKVIGGLSFSFDADRALGVAERESALAFAHQCSLSLERCFAFKDEAAARARTLSLQRVTAALANARTLDEVAARLVESVTDALGCPAAWLAVVSDDGREASIVHAQGKVNAEEWRWRRFPLDEAGPIHDVVEARSPLLFPDQRAYTAAYPEYADEISVEGLEAAAILPIIGGDRILAVLGLRFRVPSSFDDDLRELFRAISAESAHALERALLSEAERSARENLTFLLEASRVFSSSLSAEQTLENLAQLVVPRMADWCAVDLVGPGGDAQAQGFAHRSVEKIGLGRELRRRYPPRSDGPLMRVLRTGRSEAWFQMHDDVPIAISAEHGRGLRELGARSCMIVPLVAGGTVFGAVTLAMGDGEWRFGPADVALAEEIAARAAVAMANARKHEELARAREEAERANRTKDEFLAMLGHELRNPLMPILTVVELVRLHSDDGNHANKKEWSVVERQGRHLLRLVDDLLDVARITRGKIKLRRRPVEAGHLVARALETASTELEARRHRVTIEVPAEGLLIDGDEDRLVQVLSNLLNNAARYTEPGGRIDVRADGTGKTVVVRVKDTGAGLSEHLLPRVFESFVQGPRALDRSQGGLGLGLAIVKNIVELHGGEVGATSAGVGKGSEFTVSLPRADAAQLGREPVEVHEPNTSPRRKKRVLVVDDNVDAAETLADALRAHGHDVRVAHDGPAALAVVPSFKPSVALLDIGLPVMDGYELAREIIETLGSRVLLVACTGYGQPSDVERARAAGFHHHFTKPVDLTSLCTLLDESGTQQRLPLELTVR